MPRGGRRGHGGHQKRPTAACFRIPSGRVTRLLVAALLFCLFFSPCNADTALRRPPTARQLAAPSTFARAAPLSQIRTRITNPGISPYNSIVQLSFSTTTGNTTCTGVLVEEDLVLTAASCVYFARGSARGLVKPSWAYNVRVEPPGFRRGRAIQEIGVKALHVPAKFITAVGSVGYTTEAASSDYALLRLAKSVKIQRLGRLGVQAFTGTGIAVGYPRDKSGLWSSTCRITTFPLGQKNTKPNALIPCDLGSGQEGSPVLRFRNTPGVGAASLIGLIIRAPNTGTQNRIAVLNNATEMFIRRVYKGLPKDPCLRSGRTCHPQALCTTDGNRANCTCRPGLFGDGYSCGSDLCLARGLRCSVNGYCWDTGDIPRCRCNVGFVGDGVICVRPTTSRRPVTSSATGKTSSKTSTMTFKTTTLSPTPTNSIPGSCGTPRLTANLPFNFPLSNSESLVSPKFQSCLAFQDDGNLIFFSSGSILFSTETSGSNASSLLLRFDGNLVLLGSTGATIWQTRKTDETRGPFVLTVSDEGELRITGRANFVLWTPADGGYKTPTALPAAIKANLALWLDGGNPDSMPADPPMRWLDSSGNALHVSQPNPAAAPERLEDGFDFSNRGYFEGPSPLPAMAMNFTMSAVFNPSKVDGWQTIASVGRDDRDVFATSATFYLVHKNIAFDFMWGDQKFLTQTVSARKINFGSLTISAGAAAYGSVNSLGSANGASAEAGRYPNDQLQVNNTCFAIGRICPTRLNVNPFSGSIHEVMIFTTNLPEALRFWIDGYFAWKWGVVDLLPAWHLYAAAPPVL